MYHISRFSAVHFAICLFACVSNVYAGQSDRIGKQPAEQDQRKHRSDDFPLLDTTLQLTESCREVIWTCAARIQTTLTIAVLRVKSECHLATGNDQGAIEAYSRILDVNPSCQFAWGGRALCYYKRGKYRQAISDFSRLLQLAPHPAALALRADAYSELGDVKAALDDYSRAITLGPLEYAFRLDRGNLYLKQGRYEEAIGDYTQVLRLVPDEYAAYFNRGMAYAKAGKLKEALGDYTQQIRLRPKEPIGYLVRSRIYRRLGDEAKARADEEVLRKLPPIPGISITPERDAPPPPSSSQQPK